jgi:hypothetical protein
MGFFAIKSTHLDTGPVHLNNFSAFYTSISAALLPANDYNFELFSRRCGQIQRYFMPPIRPTPACKNKWVGGLFIAQPFPQPEP